MLKAGVCVSWNIPSAHTLECSPSIIRGVIFSPLRLSGNPASWMLSRSSPTTFSYPFISWILLFYFAQHPHIVQMMIFFLILHLCRPPSWQTCGITTSSGSHITFVSLWLLLSNLKMYLQSASHILRWHEFLFTCYFYSCGCQEVLFCNWLKKICLQMDLYIN